MRAAKSSALVMDRIAFVTASPLCDAAAAAVRLNHADRCGLAATAGDLRMSGNRIDMGIAGRTGSQLTTVAGCKLEDTSRQNYSEKIIASTERLGPGHVDDHVRPGIQHRKYRAGSREREVPHYLRTTQRLPRNVDHFCCRGTRAFVAALAGQAARSTAPGRIHRPAQRPQLKAVSGPQNRKGFHCMP